MNKSNTKDIQEAKRKFKRYIGEASMDINDTGNAFVPKRYLELAYSALEHQLLCLEDKDECTCYGDSSCGEGRFEANLRRKCKVHKENKQTIKEN